MSNINVNIMDQNLGENDDINAVNSLNNEQSSLNRQETNYIKQQMKEIDSNNILNTRFIRERKRLGFVNGYEKYTSVSGAIGNYFTLDKTKKEIDKDPKNTLNKYNGMLDASMNNPYINKRIHEFRTTKGFGSYNRQDPTFIVFDIGITTDTNSPLFSYHDRYSVKSFLDYYGDTHIELDARRTTYNEFLKKITEIFPEYLNGDKSGSKFHYINSISGLDNLKKKIVKYPEDNIVITLSEDIGMTAQYLAELYNNLVYSYDTHRYLIPDNLLKFNMYIRFQDIRDMKTGVRHKGIDILDSRKSQFIYVLHDCQFNFYDSRNFNDEVVNGGFGASANNTPASLNFSINYKSISRVSIPYTSSGNLLLDFREKDFIRDGEYYYPRFNDNVKTQELYLNDFNKNYIVGEYPLKDSKVTKDKSWFTRMVDKGVKTGLDEAKSMGVGITNKLKSEVAVLSSTLQRKTSDLLGGALGIDLNMTLQKINVYYDTPVEKIKKGNRYITELFGDVLDLGNQLLENAMTPGEQGFRTALTPKEGDLQVSTNDVNKKYPNGESRQDGASLDLKGNLIINKKYPSGDLEVNETYNKKYPEGDVQTSGQYNKKYPKGDVQKIGKYNKKYPDGDVQTTGEYNEKYPEGDVQTTGEYNEKYPSGDVQTNGKYNKKYPNGDRQVKGIYNEKYPEGDVQTNGQYNIKFPSGDRQANGIYNEKYPEGDIQAVGEYNKKYPSGDVQVNGQYNIKFPSGDVQTNGIYNEKYPEGDVQVSGQYNEKYPDGDVQKIGEYNKKYPEGDVQTNGTYNEKYPEGDVQVNGQYNEKFPSGDIQANGTYNEKYPDGDLEIDGEYHDKTPNGSRQMKGKYNKPKEDLNKNIYRNKK